MSKKNENKRKIHIIWDILLFAAAFATFGIFFFMLKEVPVLPKNWVEAGIGILAGFSAIYILILAIKKFPKGLVYTMRILMVLIIGLSAFLDYSFYNYYIVMDEITTVDDVNIANISIITKEDSLIRKVDNLKGKRVGIQNGSDFENGRYVKDQLIKEKVSNIEYVEALDYPSLYRMLENDEIDALIISNTNMHLLEETFPTIEADTRIIFTYQKEIPSYAINNSKKDIRYQPFTVFLAGSDEGDVKDNSRLDVNILLFVNPLSKQIKMVTIPRDTYVPNPALNNGNDKLTHLGMYGVTNTIHTLENIFGVEVDYYAKLNFFSVIDIVDALGGIEVTVPIAFVEQDENRSFAEEDLIRLDAGTQMVDGREALAFARHRKTYGDLERGMAQQEVIKGIINKLTSVEGSSKINDILKIAPDCVYTNLPMSQITNFISHELEHLSPWELESVPLFNGVFDSRECASYGAQPLSIMYLSKTDALSVVRGYDEIYSQMRFSNFNFDLNNLTSPTTQLPNKLPIEWAQ